MEPQLPTPSPTPEQGPLYTREQLPRAPERAPIAPGPERGETHEQQVAPQSGPAVEPVATPAPVAPPMPAMPQPLTDDDMGDTSAPLLAADDDVIEKEWVEKAKKVIEETKHDPHLQEQAVSKLQADYLKKRYNKTVKVPSDG